MIKITMNDVVKSLEGILKDASENTGYVNPHGEDAVELAKAAEAKGWFEVGASLDCFYVHHHGTDKVVAGCIVGKVLNDLGVTLDQMRNHEGERAQSMMNALHREGVANVEEDAFDLLAAFQRDQDKGQPWLKTFGQLKNKYGV